MNKKSVFLIVGLVLCLFMLSSPTLSYAEKSGALEYEIKAAYLYNFAKFTEWPKSAFSSSDNNFNICILGEDPFEENIDALNGRVIGGRNVLTKRIQRIRDSSGCKLLFIADSEKYRLQQIISVFMNMPVLTVSDIEGFENAGGIISLFINNNKLKFRINMEAARKAGLRISSYLLEVADTVKESAR